MYKIGKHCRFIIQRHERISFFFDSCSVFSPSSTSYLISKSHKKWIMYYYFILFISCLYFIEGIIQHFIIYGAFVSFRWVLSKRFSQIGMYDKSTWQKNYSASLIFNNKISLISWRYSIYWYETLYETLSMKWKKIRTLGVGSRGKMSAFCLFRILADGQTGHQSSCNSATFSSKFAKKYYIISLTSVMSDFITSVREILCCHDNLINSVRSSCIVKGILLLTEVLYIRECNSFSSFYLTKAIFYSWNTLCLIA